MKLAFGVFALFVFCASIGIARAAEVVVPLEMNVHLKKRTMYPGLLVLPHIVVTSSWLLLRQRLTGRSKRMEIWLLGRRLWISVWTRVCLSY